MADTNILNSNKYVWEQQYGRMSRWHERLKNASRTRKNINSTDVDDYYYTFFKECWHLKDWIVIDNNGNIDESLKQSIDTEIDENISMILCDHLANSMKHRILISNPRRDKVNLTEIMRTTSITIVKESTKKSSGKHTWTLIFNDQQIDGLELAKNCVEFWNNTIKTYNL